jgi:hypothetical protein
MNNGDNSAYPVIAPEHGPIMIGLTKREYFAAMAMQGIIAGIYGAGSEIYKDQLKEWAEDDPSDTVGGALAKDAIGYADELLKNLEQPKP